MRRLSSFQNPEKTLLKGTKQLEKYHWFLNAGTVLGFHRDGDFIPSDTDIDACILVNKEDGLDILDLEGFKPYLFTNERGQIHGLPVQRCFEDLENGVIFDIYFYYITGDKAVSPYLHDLVIPLHLYQNRQLLDTKYGKFYFPYPVEEYLEANYGKNWKIPSNEKGIFA